MSNPKLTEKQWTRRERYLENNLENVERWYKERKDSFTWGDQRRIEYLMEEVAKNII